MELFWIPLSHADLCSDNKTSVKDHLKIQTTWLWWPDIHRHVFQFNSIFQFYNDPTLLLRPIFLSLSDGLAIEALQYINLQ